MKGKFFCWLAAGLISAVVLGGCGSSDRQASSPEAGGESKLTIVTSFYPMYVSTINVTRGIAKVEVINMTKPQVGCLHDYQLTPADLTTLTRADAFVINGAGMEAFLTKALAQRADLKIIDASQGIELLKDENGEDNPHVWVSISDNITQVKNIAAQLAAIDPVNAARYQANAAEYTGKLAALRDEMHQALAGLDHKNIITFHEAFPYFAKEFNLNIMAVIEREPGTEPTPRELEDTMAKIKAADVKALFAEPQYPGKAADLIARETGARVYTLDPAVTGEARPDAYDDYLNIMRRNLATLREALQ